MGRNLTNLYISQSFQFLTQISGSELQTGLGDTITGSLLITASLANNATSASFATTASYVASVVSASYALSASNAASASVVYATSTNANQDHYVTFVATTNAYENIETDNQLTYNPNTNLLSATASYANAALSSSYSTNALSSSYAATATSSSVAINAVSASYAVSASQAQNAVTASFALNVTPINTGSFVTTASISNATTTFTKGDGSTFALTVNNVVNANSASVATSASYAISASQTQNAISSSYAVTASYALNATVNTGSLLVTASAANNVITFTKGDGSTFPVTVDTGSGGVQIFTNATGSDNAIGYASQFYSNTSPGTPGATLFVSSSFIFSNNVSASSVRNIAIVGGKNHKAYDAIGDSWAMDSSGMFGGTGNIMQFSGSNNAIIGGQSNTLEASGINNSVIVGGQSHRLYALNNSAIIGGTSIDARTASDRSVFLGGSGGTFDYFQDSAVIASNNTTFVGGTLNNVTVLSSKNISKNAVGTDITSSVVIAAVDGTQSNRNLNTPYTLYTERLQAFSGATITGSLNVSGSVTGNVLGNNTDTYTSSAAIQQIVTLTQAEYNAISASANPNTFYVVSDSTAFNPTNYAVISGSNTFVGNQVFSGSIRGNVSTIAVSSNTASLDFSTSNFFTINTTGSINTLINPINIQPGQTVNVEINYPATGSSITFPSFVKQASGSAYSPSGANTTDILTFIVFNNTSSVYLSNVKNLI